MGNDYPITLSLESDVPIFKELAGLARAFERRGRTLHVVGGMALTIWGRWLRHPRPGMTGDIDAFIPSTSLEEDTAGVATDTAAILAQCGFSRPEDWRGSRTGRFRYTGPSNVAFELLCGTPGIGKRSGTPPAHRLHHDPETDFAFYAARTPWLDCVSAWPLVSATCGTESFPLRVPSLAGLAALKIGAINDKQARIDAIGGESVNHPKLDHERRRLALHIADLLFTRTLIDMSGTLPELVTLTRTHANIRDAAHRAASWFDDHDEERARVADLQPTLRGSPDPVQVALRV